MYNYYYTTRPTYDKANQLVSSTTDGKVTHYAYDAAGRLIKEGAKSYSYGWLDKVLSVTENGKQIARFNYHNDGQIAQAIHNGKSEDFLWDGLALIHRGETSFINEPYVTGGNPVMAGDDVLFNDMLGSTLAVNGKAVEMTSFGETTDKNAFFTGKPMIDELGYSFLFRDYNPNQGKWTTSDPLGYPDGWNNLAYCNNGTTIAIDWLGAEVRLCQRSLFYSNHIFNHVWLDLKPDNPQDFSNNQQLNPNEDKTRNRGTVSGMPDETGGSIGSTGSGSNSGSNSGSHSGSNGSGSHSGSNSGNGPGDYLVSRPNADIGYERDDSYIVIPTPQGMSDTQFINAILNAQNKYDNDNPLPYAGYPGANQYNSNAFIAGLLNSLGFNGTELVQSLPGGQPGAGNPVPTRRFE